MAPPCRDTFMIAPVRADFKLWGAQVQHIWVCLGRAWGALGHAGVRSYGA